MTSWQEKPGCPQDQGTAIKRDLSSHPNRRPVIPSLIPTFPTGFSVPVKTPCTCFTFPMFTLSTAASMRVRAHTVLRTSHPFIEATSLRPRSKLCPFKLFPVFPSPSLCYLIFTPSTCGTDTPRCMAVVCAWTEEPLLLCRPSYDSTGMPGCG